MMKNRISLFLLTFCLLLTACGPAARPETDPFYFCSEEEFDWKIDRLIAKVSGLSDSDVFYELGVTSPFEEYYDGDGRLCAWETCIQPDVYVHMDIEDLRQGKDSVLEWVLAQ